MLRWHAGLGSVIFGLGTQYVVPEWFGAFANGILDDSTAIQKAYDAARITGGMGAAAEETCRCRSCPMHKWVTVDVAKAVVVDVGCVHAPARVRVRRAACLLK